MSPQEAFYTLRYYAIHNETFKNNLLMYLSMSKSYFHNYYFTKPQIKNTALFYYMLL